MGLERCDIKGETQIKPFGVSSRVVAIGPFHIDLIPAPSFGKSLSQLAGRNATFGSKWEFIRERELKRAGNRCEVCGTAERLECNERWAYDDEKLIQRLEGYEIVCHDCHSILHIGRTLSTGGLDKAVIHFSRITGLSDEKFMKAVAEAFAKWHERSKHNWRIDLSSEPLAVAYTETLNDL